MAKKKKCKTSASNQYGLGGGLVGAGLSSLTTAVNASKIKDTTGIQNNIMNSQQDYGNINNFDSLMNAQVGPIDYVKGKDLMNGNILGNMLQGATSALGAASTGSSLQDALAINDKNKTSKWAAYGGPINQYMGGGMLGSLIGAGIGAVGGGVGSLVAMHKANKEAKRLNEIVDYTNDYNDRAFDMQANNINTNMANNLLANYSAFGGNVDTKGASFPTDLTYINNGNTHEDNPYNGVQVGVDPQGTPNLVEEGETIHNNYVYSNRIDVPKDIRNQFKLGNKPLTFADASKKLNKELEENPNDPIVKRSTTKMLDALAQIQEQVKFQQEMERQQSVMNSLQQFFNENPQAAQQLAVEQAAQMEQQDPYAQGDQYFQDPYTQDQAMQEQMSQEQMAQEQMQNPLGYACGGKLHSVGGNLFVIGGPKVEGIPDYLQIPAETIATKDSNSIIKQNPIYGEHNAQKAVSDLGDKLYRDEYGPNTDFKYNGTNRALYERYLKSLNEGLARDNKNDLLPTYMGDLVGAGHLLTGLYNAIEPVDYTNANMLGTAASNASRINKTQWAPVTQYIEPKYVDRLSQTNLLNAAANTSARNIMNTSGMNAGAARASLAANDYNYINTLGSAFREAEKLNTEIREKALTFNRETDKTNSTGFMSADSANNEMQLKANSMYLDGLAKSLAMRGSVENAKTQAISGNMSGLFDYLGNKAKQNFDQNNFNTIAPTLFAPPPTCPQGMSQSTYLNWKKQYAEATEERKKYAIESAAEAKARADRKAKSGK